MLSIVGRILFGIAMLGFATQYFIYASHRPGPVPGPPWFPGGTLGADMMALVLFVVGASIAANKMPRVAAAVMSVLLLFRFAFLHLPGLIMHLHDPGPWTSSFEILGLCGGAMVLAGSPSGEDRYRPKTPDPSIGIVRSVGCFLFALLLVVVGVQHFMYARFVSTLVPAWIPWRLFWAYFVGAAFFAAAISIVSRVMARLAAVLLGIMFLLFVVTLHVPRVAAAPNNGNEWTSLFVAVAMVGTALMIAAAMPQKSGGRPVVGF